MIYTMGYFLIRRPLEMMGVEMSTEEFRRPKIHPFTGKDRYVRNRMVEEMVPV